MWMKFFYFLHYFIDVQSCEKDFWFLCYFSITKLSKNLLRCFWHEGFQKFCSCFDALDQVVENGLQTIFLCLIFCKCPRHCLVDVFVAAFEQYEDLCDCICNTQFIHLRIDSLRSIFCDSLKICIDSLFFFCLGNTLICYNTAEVFICHGNSSVYQVSKCICKVRVHTLYHQLP